MRYYSNMVGVCVSKVTCVYVQVRLDVLGTFSAWLCKNVSLTVMERDVCKAVTSMSVQLSLKLVTSKVLPQCR